VFVRRYNAIFFRKNSTVFGSLCGNSFFKPNECLKMKDIKIKDESGFPKVLAFVVGLFVLINSLTLDSNICFCATELADDQDVKVSLDWLMEQPAYSKKNYYGMSRWTSWGHTLFSLQQEKLNNDSDPYTFLYREILSAMSKGQYAHTLLEFDSVLVQLKYDVKTTERVPLPG